MTNAALERVPRTYDQIMGERIVTLMRRKRITQVALCEQLGIAQASLSRKLYGLRPWTIEELVITADVLDMHVAELFGGVVGEEMLRARRDSNPQPSDREPTYGPSWGVCSKCGYRVYWPAGHRCRGPRPKLSVVKGGLTPNSLARSNRTRHLRAVS